MDILEKVLVTPANSEMGKKDIIETILFVLSRIIDYTSELEKRTPSIFDKNYFQHVTNLDKLSPSSSSIEENSTILKISKKEENFTLNDYFYFWIKKLDFNENLLLLTIMNIDKLLAKNFILTSENVKNILFTCMVITQKDYEDENYNDKDYAKLFKISTEELISMEVEFLKYVDFSLYISEDEFIKYKRKMYKMWKKSFSCLNYN